MNNVYVQSLSVLHPFFLSLSFLSSPSCGDMPTITLVYFFIIAETCSRVTGNWDYQNGRCLILQMLTNQVREWFCILFAEIKGHNCYYSVCMN